MGNVKIVSTTTKDGVVHIKFVAKYSGYQRRGTALYNLDKSVFVSHSEEAWLLAELEKQLKGNVAYRNT